MVSSLGRMVRHLPDDGYNESVRVVGRLAGRTPATWIFKSINLVDIQLVAIFLLSWWHPDRYASLPFRRSNIY